MFGFLSFLLFVFLVGTLVCAIGWIISFVRVQSSSSFTPKHHWGRYSLIALVASIALVFACGAAYSNSPDGKADAREESRSDASSRKAASKRESSKKASSTKASSVAESKAKDKKELSSARKANEKKNFASYKKALATVPTKTHNAISKAYFDKTSEQTVLVLSDDALSLNDNELKGVVRSAWNAGENLLDNYTPFPDDDAAAALYITVQDSAGNRLAHTSAFGNFKYDD
ncbi:hypothetical protein [Lactiplantibacillus paraxiangfangensis]|uniref:hypothetical protein n=1 Tax=Lactiplantibacillus paraxiangfangensis TaxID=3076224 RepID=UPI0030C6B36F